MQSGNPANFNRYSYAFNDPINIIDPDVEKPFDNNNFEKAIVNLLNNGVVCFCVSGKDTNSIADTIDDIIINGRYEKDGWLKRKSIPTSIHQDDSVNDIAHFIDTQVRLRKLNPIINVLYKDTSSIISEWMKILKIA